MANKGIRVPFVAEVLDAVKDIEKLDDAITGVGESVQETQEGLEDTGKEAEKFAREVRQAYQKLFVMSEENAEKMRKEYADAYEKIRDSGTASAEEIERAYVAMEKGISRVNEKMSRDDGFKSAIKDLGITTDKEAAKIRRRLTDAFEAVKNSGEASAEDIARAFDAMERGIADLERRMGNGDKLAEGFRELGIITDREADAMRQRYRDAYDAVANSGTASAEEIERAFRAMEDGIAKVNAKIATNTESTFDKMARRIGDRMKTIGREISSRVSVAVGAAATGGVYAMQELNQRILDTRNQAQVSGMDLIEFQKFSAVAKSVGIEADKAGDILKDVGDKIGDLTLNEGGELQDWFDKVATKTILAGRNFQGMWGSLDPAGKEREVQRRLAEVSASFGKIADDDAAGRKRRDAALVKERAKIVKEMEELNAKEIEAKQRAYVKDILNSKNAVQAIQLIYNTIEQAGLSDKEKTNILESLADEATAVGPILANNGKLLKEIGDAAAKSGNLFDQADVDRAEKLQAENAKLALAFQGLGIALMEAGVHQMIIDMVKGFADFVKYLTQHVSPGVVKLGVVLAGLAVVVGPIIIAFGLVATAIAAISAPALAVGAIIAGIAAIVSGVAYAIFANLNAIKNAFGDAGRFIANAFGVAFKWIGVALNNTVLAPLRMAVALVNAVMRGVGMTKQIPMPGFRSGGYTGDVAEDEVAGVVHGREWVLPAAAVRRLGRGTLEALSRGIMPPSLSGTAAPLSKRSGGSGGAPVIVQLDGQSFPMRADQDVARAFEKHARASARRRSSSVPGFA